jgi:hypothetical protein
MNYVSRQFGDEFAGSPSQKIVRRLVIGGTGALGGGMAVTAFLAALLAH